jgi:sugar lactone lactonase YvrE
MTLQASKSKTRKTAANGTTARLFFLSASGGQVFSANPDGSDLRTIVSEGKRLPDGIVVDVAAGHIYWTNMGVPTANDGSIERANLDGSDATQIVPTGGTFTPKQLHLDEKSRKLYWCDREGMRIMRANLDGSKIETLIDTSEGDARPGKDIRKWCVGIAARRRSRTTLLDSEGPGQCRPGTNLSRRSRNSEGLQFHKSQRH